MRRVLVVIVMVASGSTARSEPAPEPNAYVDVGAAAVIGEGLYAAFSLEGGYRPGPYGLWVHAVLQDGSGVGPFSSQEGSEDAITSSGHFAVRAGIDQRICLAGGAWCAIAGLDVGYFHEYSISQASPRDLRGPVVVPHFGFDLGGHVRFRPTLEASVAHGLETLGLTVALAYLW